MRSVGRIGIPVTVIAVGLQEIAVRSAAEDDARTGRGIAFLVLQLDLHAAGFDRQRLDGEGRFNHVVRQER